MQWFEQKSLCTLLFLIIIGFRQKLQQFIDESLFNSISEGNVSVGKVKESVG